MNKDIVASKSDEEDGVRVVSSFENRRQRRTGWEAWVSNGLRRKAVISILEVHEIRIWKILVSKKMMNSGKHKTDFYYYLLFYTLVSFIFFTIHLSPLICILLVYKLKHSYVRSCLIRLNTKIININFL